MSPRLFLLMGWLACGHPTPTEGIVQGNEITNPSPSTWVEKLPPQKGKTQGGIPDFPYSGKTAVFEIGDHGMSLTGSVWVQVNEQYSGNTGEANFEISVEQGKVRLYVSDPEKKYRYIEATPGRPAQIFARMIPFGGYWNVVLEAVDGDAKGVKWHGWNKPRR